MKLDSQLTKDISVSSDALKYILHTTVGKGPQILSKEGYLHFQSQVIFKVQFMQKV